jgi:ureidoglycolate dehydrogenase (NAD+)
MKTINYDKVEEFILETLLKVGVDEFSSKSVAKGLSETSLRGVDSHGIRLFPHYLDSALNGRKNAAPEMRFSNKYPSYLTLDADNGFGHAAGFKAINKAIDVADKNGICAVNVINSSHPGAMASFAIHAAKNGMIAFAYTHADSLIRAFGSNETFFGTNPICMAAPRLEKNPYCLDMATSKISWNKVKIYRGTKENLPMDVAADKFGNNTSNPIDAAMLLPTGDYKGHGLSSMVEILCSIIPGIPFGPHIPSMYEYDIKKARHLGQHYMVIKTDVVSTHNDFISNMQNMTDEVRKLSSKSEAGVMLPGDPEIKCANYRQKNGIPLDDELFAIFNKISKKYLNVSI